MKISSRNTENQLIDAKVVGMEMSINPDTWQHTLTVTAQIPIDLYIASDFTKMQQFIDDVRNHLKVVK